MLNINGSANSLGLKERRCRVGLINIIITFYVKYEPAV